MPTIDLSNDAALGERVVDAVMATEGGYTNNAADKGGETIWGITKTTAIANGWGGDMKSMTRGQAAQILLDAYWRGAGCQKIASAGFPRLAYAVMDWAVNSGQYWALETMQLGLNLLNNQGKLWADIPADGNIGATTVSILQLAATKLPDMERLLVEWVNASRVVMVGHLAQKVPTQETFMVGWLRRICRVEDATEAAA